MATKWLFAVSALLSCGSLSSPSIINDEWKLRRDLFRNHDYRVRPVLNQSDTITVDISFYLQGVYELNERQQALKSSGYLSIRWVDRLLTWDPDKYGGTTELLMKPSEIWVPDITVINGATGYIYAGSMDFLVLLKSTGSVDWTPGAVFETNCPIDVTLYPFDTQSCEIIISTWMHSVSKLSLRAAETTPENLYFWESGEWKFVDMSVRSESVLYSGANYSILHFSIVLQRRRSFYVLNVILPVCCLSVLNVLVFLVPPESGEKMSLSITVLLAYSVFLSIVSGNMPGTSNSISLLAVYLVFVLVVGMVAAFTSALVLRIFHRKGRQLAHGCADFCSGSQNHHTEDREPTTVEFVNSENNCAFYENVDMSNKSDVKCVSFKFSGEKYKDMAIIIDRYVFWSFLALTLLGFVILVIVLLS